MQNDTTLLDDAQAAALLRAEFGLEFTSNTLRLSRWKGQILPGVASPPYVQVGQRKRYLTEDLRVWAALAVRQLADAPFGTETTPDGLAPRHVALAERMARHQAAYLKGRL
jgi:hypothetical protein